jgi:RNA polymerase sigma-70 factor (ECF subfamily)
MPENDFAAFLLRIRAGDEAAAAELVRQFEPLIRREVRLRLHDASVARILDDEDVCQSVLASFFVRTSLGQYDLHDPAQLRQLLLSMARNKLAHAIRRRHTQKQGGDKAPLDVDDQAVSSGEPTASRIVAARELLEMVRQRLSDDERRVADLRSQGHDWAEVAATLGGTPDGRRMQLSRALDRIGATLDLEGADG